MVKTYPKRAPMYVLKFSSITIIFFPIQGKIRRLRLGLQGLQNNNPHDNNKDSTRLEIYFLAWWTERLSQDI